MKSIPSLGERLQIPHHRLVSGRNQGVGTMTCSYCHQMGHLFNCCPFINDRLRQLLREEVMNIHQHVLPTTTIIINLFGFTLMDNISEWGENYVQDHPNYTFEELEQTFYKRFKTMKNDEKVYMQL